MLVTRVPGSWRVEAARVEVLLAQHVVEVDAGAGRQHAGAGPVRAGDAGGVALRVEHRDVRRRPERPAARATRSARGDPLGAPRPRADPPRNRSANRSSYSRSWKSPSRARLGLGHHLGKQRERRWDRRAAAGCPTAASSSSA